MCLILEQECLNNIGFYFVNIQWKGNKPGIDLRRSGPAPSILAFSILAFSFIASVGRTLHMHVHSCIGLAETSTGQIYL